MRTPVLRKIDGDTWECRPFQGWHYRIIKRWLKGYVLYFNGAMIHTGTRLNEMKQLAKEHLASDYRSEKIIK